MRPLAVCASLLLLACSSDPPTLEIVTTPELEPAVAEMAQMIDYPIAVSIAADPPAALPAGKIAVAVTADVGGCAGDCYQITASGSGYLVAGGTALGAQHGLFRAMEGLDFGFFHPHRTATPDKLPAALPDRLVGELVEPEVARRGLHLHILHTIEPYYAFWEPGETSLENAKRMVNWGIAIGANYFQWTALDNILDPAAGAAWREHTGAILDYIHGRGATAGVGIQLFGGSNLQHAYDLVDDSEGDVAAQIAERYPPILDGLSWDHVSLSFGEFLGEEPQRFIDSTNLAYAALGERSSATMSGTIHVGDDQRITFMDQEMIYYFLVQFADPGITPWVHTVMYYNLFEDAGGAYHHDDFAEHRQFLYDRITAGQPVGYHPETAYWVAFDNSVPTYTPVYMRSRWLDLDRIATEAGPLPEHIVFSSGWEWGYWQNDAIAFRQSVRRSASWQVAVEELFAPLGEPGAAMAAAAIAAGELEHEMLIERRLAAYLAGRDAHIDLGDAAGIIGAPDRPGFAEIAALAAAELDAFEADVIDPLAALGAGLDEIADELSASGATADVFGAEMRDGLEVTAERARFIGAAYRAAIAVARGGEPEPALADLETALDRGRAIVDRRHAALFDPDPDRLLRGGLSVTLYQFGYLKQADELCYWQRERRQLLNLARGESAPVPSCTL
jgi:hypothetical protein